jgi:hypothetical protein
MSRKEKLVTRDSLARIARAEGMNVTDRTLRYWAMRGLIPKPIIKDRKACYPISLISILRKIEPLRRKTIEEVRDMVWESSLFECHATSGEGGVIVTFKPKRGSRDGLERLSSKEE